MLTLVIVSFGFVMYEGLAFWINNWTYYLLLYYSYRVCGVINNHRNTSLVHIQTFCAEHLNALFWAASWRRQRFQSAADRSVKIALTLSWYLHRERIVCDSHHPLVWYKGNYPAALSLVSSFFLIVLSWQQLMRNNQLEVLLNLCRVSHLVHHDSLKVLGWIATSHI